MEVRRFRKATLREVAAKAGVSTTTVSLFVSGDESVCSPATAERIRGAVAALNYIPNSLTRGLRQGQLTTIGVCLRNPLDVDVDFGAVYFEKLWRGVMRQADEENYSLLHYPVSIRDSRSHIAFLDGRVEGILLHDHGNPRARYLCEAGMPTVLLDRAADLPDGCGAASADESAAVDLALTYLWDLGHRRIAHVAGPMGDLAPGALRPNVATALDQADDVAVRRFESYRDWMRARRAFDPQIVEYAQAWSTPNADAVLVRWRELDHPPTAVFCANDAQAVDIIVAAQSQGLRVPQDISVVGVDDSLAASKSDPPLTSVRVPVEEVGQEGVRALLALFHGAPVEECRICVPVTQISIRESSGPPPSCG